MNLEDRAREWLVQNESLLRERTLEENAVVLSILISELLGEAVKAREKQIADELDALLGTAYEARQTKLTHIVAQLRNGEKS